jgi:hypothetical protein
LNESIKRGAGEGLENIRALLLDGITTQTSSGVRFCAVQWATRLFPFSDATARYICMLAAADKKIEIREAGLNGLKQELFKSEAAGTPHPLRTPTKHDSAAKYQSTVTF